MVIVYHKITEKDVVEASCDVEGKTTRRMFTDANTLHPFPLALFPFAIALQQLHSDTLALPLHDVAL
ncbi:uncharacterized [Tachysurus ichikawai]